jgi:hypothetical protein
MITYYPHMKSIHELKFVVIDFFKFQNIISKCSNFENHLLDVCKWVLMCMTYEQSCDI